MESTSESELVNLVGVDVDNLVRTLFTPTLGPADVYERLGDFYTLRRSSQAISKFRRR